ncbi:MAG: hypothetical protein R3341_07240 [Methylophaga sp.]|nr:hypothetical protein [Methylophaga sp.]
MALPIYISKQQNDNPKLFHLRMRDFITQNREDGWIEIMDYCCEQVPYLLKSGTPSEDDLEKSLIGELGFKSWRSFLEDIGWSMNTWRYWRKAYGVVLKHKYLRKVQPKKSHIHFIKARYRGNFPEDNEAWQAAVASLRDSKKTNQLDVHQSQAPLVSDNSRAETKVFQFKSFGGEQINNKRVKDLEAELLQAKLDNQKIQVELNSKSQANECLVTESKVLRQSNIELEDELDVVKKEMNKLGIFAVGLLFFICLFFISAVEIGAFA